MAFFRRSKPLLGLDIGSSSVKAAELKKAGSGYELASLGIEALGPDTVVDGAIMDSNAVSFAVNSIVEGNKIKTKHVATAVAGHSVIVKRVAIPASSEAELAGSISLEAQQHIPFEIDDVNLSYQIMGVGPTGNDMDVMLVHGYAAKGVGPDLRRCRGTETRERNRRRIPGYGQVSHRIRYRASCA